jgi:hypothetical protein
MNGVDAVVFVLLALADIALIVHLRGRHNRRERVDRIQRSLAMAVQMANGTAYVARPTVRVRPRATLHVLPLRPQARRKGPVPIRVVNQ